MRQRALCVLSCRVTEVRFAAGRGELDDVEIDGRELAVGAAVEDGRIDEERERAHRDERDDDAHEEEADGAHRGARNAPSERIDGTQRPTNTPCSWLPVNHSVMERTSATAAASRKRPRDPAVATVLRRAMCSMTSLLGVCVVQDCTGFVESMSRLCTGSVEMCLDSPHGRPAADRGVESPDRCP